MADVTTTQWAMSEEKINKTLAALSAEERVRWSLDHLPATHVLSSSFGVQSATMLHMLSRQKPDIPIIVIDTGYLFPETYQFIDELLERLDLNLYVAQPALSPTWLEARYGKLWEQGKDGIERYNKLSKVEPMKDKLDELDAGTWFAGLRRVQASSRRATPFAEVRHGRIKVHPIADWTDRDVGMYLKKHDLPYHPLWEKGYVSVGDVHTTRPLEPGMSEEDTRFFGLKRECGLHTDL